MRASDAVAAASLALGLAGAAFVAYLLWAVEQERQWS